MRLLFASVGAYGHIFPLVPLALAARDAGHEVVFATHGQFHTPLRAAGLPTVEAGGAVREVMLGLLAGGAGSPREAAPRAFGAALPRSVISDLVPYLEEFRPDLVVYEVLNPGAGIAAGLLGVPAVCHGISPVVEDDDWPELRAAWVATAGEYGLAVPDEHPELFGNPYLDISPPSLHPSTYAQESGQRIPLRPVPWNQPGELPAAVRERDRSRPLVYLTLGTAFGTPAVLRQAIAGLAALPVDVLVAAGPHASRGEIGELPDNVVVEGWLPQADLLPHVDLVVSHGGSGTMLAALAHGLPHLALPQGADQFTNAQLLVTTGAGGRILPGAMTAEAVDAGAGALLDDPGARSRAGEIGKEIAELPSPAETVPRLVDMVR